MHAFRYKNITCFPWTVLIWKPLKKIGGNISRQTTPQPPGRDTKKFHHDQNAQFFGHFFGGGKAYNTRDASKTRIQQHQSKDLQTCQGQSFLGGRIPRWIFKTFFWPEKKPRIEQSSYLEDHFRTCKLVSNCCVRHLPYKQLRVLK